MASSWSKIARGVRKQTSSWCRTPGVHIARVGLQELFYKFIWSVTHIKAEKGMPNDLSISKFSLHVKQQIKHEYH